MDNDGARKSDEITIKITKGVGSFLTANPTSGDAPLTVKTERMKLDFQPFREAVSIPTVNSVIWKVLQVGGQ
jgi:hypothetical protein